MQQTKTAFITGISGQDGAYLAQFLLEKNYKIHGLVRWDSYIDSITALERLDKLGLVNDDITIHVGDITDASFITQLVRDIKPDEIYNLAAISHVKVSFGSPSNILDINTKGTLNILDAVRTLGFEKTTRIYQASSSEMFGSTPAPQNEQTPMNPCSPYGVSKLASFHLAKIYRESYDMFITNGILFNHESPLRGEDFVTKKITRAVARIEAGRQDSLTLGNLDSLRDWGDARDYVRGMWMMLQYQTPDDFILATGQAASVRSFTTRAFAHIGIKLKWKGTGSEEIGKCIKTGKTLVTIDPDLYRPNEVHHLLGDTTKARQLLGWQPTTNLDDLIAVMINADREDIWAQHNADTNTWIKTG